jgi:hypothetical protein
MGAKESIMTTIAKIMEEIEANTWAGIADELKARYGGEVADYEEYEWDVGGNPIGVAVYYNNGNIWHECVSGDGMELADGRFISVEEVLDMKVQ